MKPTHTLLTLCLLACLIIAPAAAVPPEENTHAKPHIPADNEIAKHHPLGWTHGKIRETIAEVVADKNLRPHQKLQAQTEALGMDARLLAWLEAERDMETGEPIGEPIYPKNIPVITPILSFFSLAKETPAEPYTQAEGEAAYSAYLDRYLAEYKPCGEFGGPIR